MIHDINTSWGSHADTLAAALAGLPADSLVIEHGAGMYSSAVIARYPVRVLCIEEQPGWSAWARWLYESAGRQFESLERAKLAVSRLTDAALVFIDGAARERGDLLKWSLEARVPLIIAHDTEERKLYGYQPHYFTWRGYTVEHDGREAPRTTIWRLTP